MRPRSGAEAHRVRGAEMRGRLRSGHRHGGNGQCDGNHARAWRRIRAGNIRNTLIDFISVDSNPVGEVRHPEPEKPTEPLERFTPCAGLLCDAPPWPSWAAAGPVFPQH
jgi:hypothetical protein